MEQSWKNVLIVVVMIIMASCEREKTDPQNDRLIFPVGRSSAESSLITLTAGGKNLHYDLLSDSCGGYWFKISKSDISSGEEIVITLTRKKNTDLFSQKPSSGNNWIKPSYYIDSENDKIVLKSAELTNGLSTNIEKAKTIQRFVINHLEMKVYKDSFLEKASKTYESGYGSCMNFSRLYVALCRAAGIPARTIWGVVYGYNNDKVYDYHHQWAEILDESGSWHPADFNYTTSFDLNDVRYLDLVYAAEENTIIKDRSSYTIIMRNLKYYNDYPVTLDGRLGFSLKSDNRPDSMVIEYKYQY